MDNFTTEDICVERFGISDNEYRRQIDIFNSMFPDYFDAVNQMVKNRNIDSQFLFDKYSCSVQDSYNDIILTYAELNLDEILFSVNANNYRALDAESLLFIKEKIIFPFKMQIFFINEGLGRQFNLDGIHGFRDIVPYVLETYDKKEDLLIGEEITKSEEEKETERLMDAYSHDTFENEIKTFESKDYGIAINKYKKIKDETNRMEMDTIQIICGDFSAETKVEKIDNYLDFIDSLYHNTNQPIVMQISAQLEECYTKFPAWSSVTESEILDFKDEVTFNYLLILFHAFRLKNESMKDKRLLDSMLFYFRKHFKGEENSQEVDNSMFLCKNPELHADTVKLVACYNNLVAYYQHHKKYFIPDNNEEIFSNKNIVESEQREQMLELEIMDVLKENYALLQKNKTLLLNSDDEMKPIIEKEITKVQNDIDIMKNSVEAKYAKEVLGTSLDVIFLLREYINLKQRITNDKDLINIKNKIRIIEAEIKNSVYSNPYILDFYREDQKIYNMSGIEYNELKNLEKIEKEKANQLQLENEIMLEKSDADETERINLLLEIDEKDYQIAELDKSSKRNMLMKEYYRSCIEALKEDDIETIMDKRNDLLSNCDLLLMENEEEIEKVSQYISDIVQKIVAKDITKIDIDIVLEKELGVAKKILPVENYKTLYTAEYLYTCYIVDENAKTLLDYSCISALYYQALEGAYNSLIFSGYIKSILSEGLEKEMNRYKTQKMRKGTDDIAFGYFPEKRNGKDCFFKYWQFDKEEQKIKENCMYGDFIYLLEKAKDNSREVTHFIDYLKKLWNKENLDTHKMKVFCDGLEQARPRRNDASHGGTIITKKGAETDKKTVLLEKRTAGLKDLIVKLCEFFIEVR